MILAFLRRHVGAKIILGYLLALLLIVGIGYLAIVRLTQINAMMGNLTDRLAVEKELAQDIVSQIWRARFYANKYVRTQSQSDLDSFDAEFARLNELLNRADSLIVDSARRAELERIKPAVREYGEAFAQAAELIKKRQKIESETLDVQGLLIDNKLTALRVSVNTLNDPRVFLAFGNAQNGFQIMRLNVARYLATDDEGYVVVFEKGYQDTITAFANLEATLQDPVQRKNASDAKTAATAYYQGFQTIHADNLQLKQLFKTRLDALEPQISDTASRIAAGVAQEFAAQNASSQAMVTQTRLALIGATVLALLAGLSLGVWISRSITGPLHQVMRASQQIANVDLRALTTQLEALAQGDVRLSLAVSAQPLAIGATDEVGQMASAFNEIIASFHRAESAFQDMAIYLNKMAETATSIAQGHLEVSVPTQSPTDVLGNALAGMVENLRAAEASLQRQLRRLAVLRDIDSMITTGTDLNATLQFLLTQAVSHLEVDAAEILLFDPQTHEWEQSAQVGLPEHTPCPPSSLDEGYAGRVVRQGEPVILNDLDEHARALDCRLQALGAFNAYGGIPLVAQQQLKGVMQLFSRSPIEADREWMNFWQTLAGQAAIAISNHELIRGLERRVAQRTAELEAQKEALSQIALENASLYHQVQQEKQYLESLLQNSPVAIVAVDLEGTIVSWNPAAEKLFGYTQTQSLGRNIDELVIPPNLEAEARSYSAQTLHNGALIRTVTQRRRQDGSLVDVEVLGVPVIVEGQQVGGLAIYHDITELQQARQAAEAANRAKSAFLAAMSHEIRTPMNGVIGMTSLLLDTALTPEQRDYVETIRDSGEALLTIINDILDFSKIEAGKLELENQPFDVRECIESALELVATKAREKNLELAYIVEAQIPGMVMGDVTRLRQILLNLLSNACKFTEQGEIVVSVDRRNGDVYHFAVRDTGIGIPPDRMDRLFQSFSQVDASTTRKYGGTGLGLAISKRLAEMMGGTMWVESEGIPGRGSTFHFTIQAQPAPAQARVYMQHEQPQLQGRRALIVDDNATNRRILADQLRAWNMLPRATASPHEALEWIRQGDPFDVALLDMQMPEMDGAMLAAEIRRQRNAQQLPIVILSSLGQREAGLETLQLAAFLTKPVKQSALYNTLIEIFIGQGRAEAETRQAAYQFDGTLAARLPLRILVAEDNAVNQKLALQMLHKLGYRADIAGNGLEVLQALARQPYDIILMDVQMPEMDGLEASRRIRQQRLSPPPRIIAMTANAMEGDREMCLAAGMDDYISKPIRPQELQTALERWGTHPAAPPPGNKAADASSSAVDWTALDGLRALQEEGQPDFVQEVIDLYLADAPALIDTMRQALAQGQPQELKRAAHTLKSNSKSVGAQRLGALSFELEKIGGSGELASAPALLDELEREFERVRAALSNYHQR